MNRDIVKLSVLLAAVALASGCATSGDAGVPGRDSMISAAEFDAMITIEMRELEPLPVDEAFAAVR